MFLFYYRNYLKISIFYRIVFHYLKREKLVPKDVLKKKTKTNIVQKEEEEEEDTIQLED